MNEATLLDAPAETETGWIRWLETVGIDDIGLVGGKNASLGEMIRHLSTAGIAVPPGFAVTADAYRALVSSSGLFGEIYTILAALKDGTTPLGEAGEAIRALLVEAELPDGFVRDLRAAYRDLGRRVAKHDPAVAVRSSATAEDLPDASFAGQQETFLNVVGETALIDACRRCYASLFTDRAIAYRQAKGFDHLKVALSIGVQLMVRSDKAGSGVMFTLDTETGFPRVVEISAAWGLGETVVQGSVDPDSYLVFKPLLADTTLRPIIERRCGAKARKLVYAHGGSSRTRLVDTPASERRALLLDDEEVLTLARWAVAIEAHYRRPMDMEWAKDGDSGTLYVVQARPETVQSARSATTFRTWQLDTKATPVLTGSAVGQAIATGTVSRILDPRDLEHFPDGAILVTEMTDPDWVPLMRRAAGIVTDHGGPTSHAAIVSRELGVPAVVGTGTATQMLADGEAITLSCAGGEAGQVYRGTLPFTSEEVKLDTIPDTRTALMVNLANPGSAFGWWRLPAKGVGLARIEFIISSIVRIHPMALVHPERVADVADAREIARLTRGFADPTDYFVDRLARGIARIAATFHPHPAIVRLSDFKTNEYAHLLGGAAFEPVEENPMLGLRGASRYYHPAYREGFALECRALKRVREEMGFTNVVVMVPFCRTPGEADKVLAELAANGLERGKAALEIYVMCEIPANVLRAEEFAARFDGFSIGSNDLTQLVLGVDRDSPTLAPLFDERDPAVTGMIADVIARAHACGAKIGICGQAPSNHPDFARFLVEHGIDSISLNPDSFVATLASVAAAEKARA
ncbi:phosphoenolpyruvate synthase [Hephaestia mangrovi]|uniref:phosphoenolpyruvate synthase n=1 Tax=Hephaestia mangrovi TaxID=2873268 RepID=UPI001CA6E046|nr:phosphoenolpyruvate synthase [Hephaestia mangrovi]MBY8829428.1 phosphoenolpyruvate synthase [Hephaestia mangrovi]